MAQNWRSEIEGLRMEFKDASKSYPKLFHARLVGSRIGASVWRRILGEKSFLSFSERRITDDRCDQTCLYAESNGDSVMLEHARTRFMDLAKRSRDCLSEMPEEFLRMVDPHAGRLSDGPEGWLDFVYDLAGGFDKPFKADQEKLFNAPDGSGKKLVRVPAIVVKHSPESFPDLRTAGEPFDHVYFAMLSPDVCSCSSFAIEEVLRRTPGADEGVIVATWREQDGSQTTWVVPDDAGDVLTRLEATHGEPISLVHFPASRVAPDHGAVGHGRCRLVAQLDRLLWPQASEVADTKGFKEKSHEELLQALRQTLDELTSLQAQTSITHSLAEAGCDATIVFPANELKCGIQIKSYRDINDRGFARNTLAQIQESRRHGLARLYLMLAGDLTDQSQRVKVRSLTSRLSQAKEDYVRVIPPERAWTLLFRAQPAR